MARSSWPGFAELSNLFDQLPADAEDALKKELPQAAELILSIQKGDAPVRTGALSQGLSIQTLNGGLKVRAGLLGNTDITKGKRGLNSLFYGRFVEFGRKSQVVLVERRRRVGGVLRTVRGRKIPADLYKAYTLKVAPAAPRPFVDTPQTEAVASDALEAVADLVQSKMEAQ